MTKRSSGTDVYQYAIQSLRTEFKYRGTNLGKEQLPENARYLRGGQPIFSRASSKEARGYVSRKGNYLFFEVIKEGVGGRLSECRAFNTVSCFTSQGTRTDQKHRYFSIKAGESFFTYASKAESNPETVQRAWRKMMEAKEVKKFGVVVG